MKTALLSLYDKDGAERFAQLLVARGFQILSSGGTAAHLRKHGVRVTDLSEVTGYPPVLGHRVVTLAPQIHGGLLASADMQPELERLGWKRIDLLYVTFYPLAQALAAPEATFASCIEKTDIGGPTMVRSANKGGEAIVMTSRDDENPVLEWIDRGMPDRERFLLGYRRRAESRVSEYVALSAQVYERFSPR